MKQRDGKVYIASHRGFAAGNIPCNTTPAFQCAIDCKSDIIELDVSVSADNNLFVSHPGLEPVHLNSQKLICDMTADEVEALRFYNYDKTRTQFGVERFEQVMSFLKGKIKVNVDKFWTAPEEIASVIRKLHMENEVIIKTFPNEADIDAVEKYAPDLPYMPIITEENDFFALIANRNLNCIGAEVIYKREDSFVASDEFISRMHENNYLLWTNAIVYNYKDVLAAGHSDDIAVAGNPDGAWGWMVEKGFDIIQTDWTSLCRAYVDRKCSEMERLKKKAHRG